MLDEIKDVLRKVMFIRNIQTSLSFTQKYNNEVSNTSKLKAGIGSLLGTAVPLMLMMKKRKITNPFKMNYGLQDMIILSGSSVLGGVATGMIGENNQSVKKKLKEGVFQFLNAAIPTWIIGGVLKLPESSLRYNNVPTKIFSVLGGLAVGMFGAVKISNLLFDPKDKEPDRKLTFKDCLVNSDDVLGALVLAKVPLIDKLGKFLPLVYSYCGYRAGKTN